MYTDIDAYQLSGWLPPEFVSLQALLFAAGCYIYGAIPFAYIFTYLFKRERITEKGTGNIGVANAFGVGGLRVGFLSVAGEASKVVLALALSHYYYDSNVTVSLILITVSIFGASFSPFLKGKGGQGGTILLWTLLLLSPYTFLAFLAFFVIAFLLIRNRYTSSIIGHALLPFEIFLIDGRMPFVFFGVLAAIFYNLRYNARRSDYAYYKGEMKLLQLLARTIEKKRRYVISVEKAKDPSRVGFQASKLRYLKKVGLRIPRTYVCTFAAHDEYAIGDQSVLSALRAELEEVTEKGKKYSIRSYTNLEDKGGYPFAGPFESCLNGSSIEEVVKALVGLWESVRAELAHADLNRIGKSPRDLKIGVIVQEMVDAQWSGVVFTRNPVNGFDEVVVEAIRVSGDSPIQKGVTPSRWIHKWGNWVEQPVNGDLNMKVVGDIVAQAKATAKKYGQPLSLEWAYDGKELLWLQLEAITTLREINIYSNRISKEYMPGIIKPLIWSINIPVVNTSWKQLLVELVGVTAKRIDINHLAKPFYYRAYFNMGVIGDVFELLGMPRELIELLLGIEVASGERPRFRPGFKTIRFTPRMLLFALRMSLFSRRIDRFLAAQGREYEHYARINIDELNETETLNHIEVLLAANTRASYYVIVSYLLMGFFNTVLARILARRKINVQEISFASVSEQLHDIDPSYHLLRLHDKYETLPDTTKRKIQKMQYYTLSESSELDEFRRDFEEFLSRFGHLSESSNDFSKIPYRETPESVLAIIESYQGKKAQNGGIDIVGLSRGLLESRFLRSIYNSALKYRVYRERVNFLYVYGYSLFRPYFMRLARLLKAKGCIAEEEDIFYLTFNEISTIARTGIMTDGHKLDLVTRKEEIDRYRDIELPDLVVGDVPPIPLMGNRVGDKLKGLAASKGYCEGKVRVVTGIHDFAKVVDDEILVIPHSDISWTPIFAKAKAIVSESGGMLSHCSIVAREYNIPAVVSVPNALRLQDGTMVAVDGYSGEVLVMK